MSFIAPTRSKKLKKLCLIAHSLITEWGWGYFWYVAQKEWKEKGISIFYPDQKPIALFDRISFQESYQNYLNHIQFSNIKDSSNSNLPQITFLVYYESKKIQNLLSLLKSFLDQSFDNWNIILISKNNDPVDFSLLPNDNRISLVSSTNIKLISDKINSLEYDFLGLIDSNVILPSYSLLEFVTFLKKNPNSDILYSDHDSIDENGKRFNPFFKPNWSLTTFLSFDYISSLCIVKKDIAQKVLKNKILNDFSFDFLLYCINSTNEITHVPSPLYSKIDSDPFFSNEYKKNILIKYFQENNIDAKIENGILPDTFRINYNLKSQPKVSIFIPTKNNRQLLQRCINSIEKNTNYKNIEIIIIDNPAKLTEIYFDSKLEKYYDAIPYKVIRYEGNFNFSKMNNMAVKESTGDLLLFLNDDTKILSKSKDWLDEMVSILLQDDVGVVGPKLLFADDTIQHAGMVFLKTGSGFHPFMKLDDDSTGYHNFANIMKECSAVTGACLLTKRDIFEQIGEYDDDFDVYYGDSDLCLKIIDAGYKVVYTPFAKLLHDGSRTIRGRFNFNYFAVESHLRFMEKWPELKKGDPFYHPMLDWDYSLNIEYCK
jgi:GT2 family glycosyltransferase